jgi:two-component system, NtrC family, sensor histidine kinase HydH
MRAQTFSNKLVIPAAVVLFVGLGLLAVFFIRGESRRARILAEYETDRVGSVLLDAYRAEGSADPPAVDPRVIGFGIYRSSARAIMTFGTAPAYLDAEEARIPFRFNRDRGTLTLVRPLGMMEAPPRGLRLPGGIPPGPGMGMMRNRGPMIQGRGGTMFLAMNIASYYHTRTLYAVSAVAAPLLVGLLATAFFLLLVSNTRYRRRAEERETMARLGESARTLAHEIRNPLGAIRIQTALLRRRLPAGSAPEIDVIDEEAERLNALSRRVGELLKDPSGSPETIALPDFIADCIARSPFPASVTPPIPACAVRFDRELLRLVIENLVRNAHESYGEDGEGPTGRPVEIAASLEGTHVALTVSDRGKGIAPGLEEKIFDPFFTDKVHGSGIGLSLCRRCVTAVGGTLVLLPRAGGGTEARIVLPLRAGT